MGNKVKTPQVPRLMDILVNYCTDITGFRIRRRNS